MSNMVATGQEMFREKNFFKVREKSGNFTSSQGKFYGHIIIILFMKLNNKLIVGFQKVDPFCTFLLRSYTVSIHVHCMCLAESIN